MSSPVASSSPTLSNSDYEQATEQSTTPEQRQHSAAEHPSPSANTNPYSSPIPFQQQSQQPWFSSSPRPPAPSFINSTYSTFNSYQLPSSNSYTPQQLAYSPGSALRPPYYHPSPYSPWAGIPSSVVYGSGAVTTTGGSDGYMPPSQLHIPHHYRHSLPPPYGSAYPPHSSFNSSGTPAPVMGFSSGLGERRTFDSLDDGGYSAAEEEGRAGQRRKLDHSAESDEEEWDAVDCGGQETNKVVKGGQIVDLAQAEDQGGPAEKQKPAKKGAMKKGVRVDDPYDIPSITDVKPFVSKLHFLLANPDQFGDVICWDTTGTRIMIKMKDPRLTSEVLPRAFGHNKPASLGRQFSVYNFSVMRILKDEATSPPSPSVSAALPASAPRNISEWRTYQRSDSLFTRDTFTDIETLKQLNLKETSRTSMAGSSKSGGGKKKVSKKSEDDSDDEEYA